MENMMTGQRRNWVRLDNASNIFLAAMNPQDTKVFRLSAEMEETVDPDFLQQALDQTYANYRLYHSVLRRGIFWYYLEESDLRPQVKLDTNPTCEALYHFDRRELLFRVVYWKKRISLEVFHALSDGTGALWFFQDLVQEYVHLKHPESRPESSASPRDYSHHRLVEDSFARYFRKSESGNFTKVAQSAIRSLSEYGKLAGRKASGLLMPVADPNESGNKVYQVKGTRTPDDRPRVVEMEMPVRAALSEAKRQQTSLTIYLTALFMEAIRRSAPQFKGAETMAVSVPVNLRQFFPSDSARNFFSVTRLEYTYGEEPEGDTLETICRKLKEQFEPQLSKESLEGWLSRLIAFEYNPMARVIVRPLKDLALKWMNYRNNRNLTIAISNLGRISFAPSVDEHVQQVYFHTVAVRPQFCAISHGDVLTVSFTGPFVETDIQREFARMLRDVDIPVTVAVNKVTKEELEGGGGRG